jgi:hypothetical protein
MSRLDILKRKMIEFSGGENLPLNESSAYDRNDKHTI